VAFPPPADFGAPAAEVAGTARFVEVALTPAARALMALFCFTGAAGGADGAGATAS
jgi:hypothetical protein